MTSDQSFSSCLHRDPAAALGDAEDSAALADVVLDLRLLSNGSVSVLPERVRLLLGLALAEVADHPGIPVARDPLPTTRRRVSSAWP